MALEPILIDGEYVDRVLVFQGVGRRPDLTYRGEPLVRDTSGGVVYFSGGPKHGEKSCMPGGCDIWVEPDGSVYA